ncbi:hypothetical protein Tco_1549076 [Tanacetum coccineum]
MVISSPCLIDNKELTIPEQTALGKDFSNPLIVDSLLKTIWSSMHHVFTMKHWLVQSKRLLVPAEATTDDNGEARLLLPYDGHQRLSLKHLTNAKSQVDDQDELLLYPTQRFLEQLALMDITRRRL